MEERGVAQGIGPQCKGQCCGPSGPDVQRLLACALGELAHAALGYIILEVGIDTTKGKLLLSVVTCLFEGIVQEAPIVAVIVLDPNAVLSSEGLEGAFCGNGFDQRVIDLRMDILQATEVVDEDGRAAIALLGEFAF